MVDLISKREENMKKTKVQNFVNLDTFAGGALAEKLSKALEDVARNIQDPNTEPTAKRAINITMKFSPNKSRNVVGTSISVQTKLATAEAIDTQLAIGIDLRTGELQIAEYGNQIQGQITMGQYQAELEKQQADQASGEEETTAPEAPDPIIRKPIDLRERSRRPAQETDGQAYDPETGEIMSGASSAG